MFNTQFLKAGMGVMLSTALVLSACSGESGDKKRTVSAASLVEEAKKDIAAKRYPIALNKCVRAEEIDDSYDEAKYCVLASSLGSLVSSLDSVFNLVANLSPAKAQFKKHIDANQLLSSAISDIEGNMAFIDAYAYKLAAMENPKFHIEDFPLGLDPTNLMSLLGDSAEIKVKGDLALNVGGTWDKSQAVALGALVNALQGALDYVLSHKLTLDDLDITLSPEGLAKFLVRNEQLLVGHPDTARLKGDGTHKGLRKDVLAALSYIFGRDTDEEKVAPAFGGLREAIKVSAQEADPNAVIKWVDKNGDGLPEEIGLPALSQLKDKILDDEDKPIIENDTFAINLETETWNALITFGEDLRDNIEANGADPVALKPLLETIKEAVTDEESTTRLLFRDVPDILALNPGKFLAEPKYIADMLPYFYSYNYAAESLAAVEARLKLDKEPKAEDPFYNLAIEAEKWDADSDTYFNRIAGYDTQIGLAGADDDDFDHFVYQDGQEMATGIKIAKFNLHPEMPQKLAADKVTATTKSPLLYYIALQDASLGGLLEGDLSQSGSYAALDNATFNEGLARLVKYYCLDLTTDESLGREELIHSLDNNKYDDDNKIADCEEPFK